MVDVLRDLYGLITFDSLSRTKLPISSVDGSSVSLAAFVSSYGFGTLDLSKGLSYLLRTLPMKAIKSLL